MEANFWPKYIANLPASQNNYFATNPSIGYSYNGVIKLDHNFNEKHHLSGRWFGGQGDQIAPLGGSAALDLVVGCARVDRETQPRVGGHHRGWALSRDSIQFCRANPTADAGAQDFHRS